MIVHIQKITDTEITGMIRAQSDDGTVGDSRFEMSPGDSWNGVTFEMLAANGVGPFEVPNSTEQKAELPTA